MTDNTQELDEILDFIENYGVSASCDGFDPHKSRSQAKQALLDWHNKQIEAVLDRLESQSRRADDCTDDTLVVKMIRVGAERDRLNSSKSTPFNKLKESK